MRPAPPLAVSTQDILLLGPSWRLAPLLRQQEKEKKTHLHTTGAHPSASDHMQIRISYVRVREILAATKQNVALERARSVFLRLNNSSH